jgi:serine/threonine protein kinase
MQARLLERVNAPKVVKLLESGISSDGAVFWLVMEYLEGKSLSVRLRNSGPIPQLEAIKVSIDLPGCNSTELCVRPGRILCT